MSKAVPIIAIVGRANVGKSSLFNAILERREAIVAREAGTTRDSIMAKAEWAGQNFWLVDTAGMKDAEDDFEFTIQEQILQATDSADVIWVVVEADVPISEEDRKVAKLALKSKKPVFLVVNKIDKTRKGIADNYQRLGVKQIFQTSTTQNRGIDKMLDELIKVIPKATITEDDDRLRIALLGRPNVGKSYLFNTLSKKQQAIVADVAGTTRDINRSTVRYKTREIEIMDTAGIRRNGKIERGIEHFSVIRSLAAIEQADICLLLLDVNELSVQLDQKIAGMIKEAGKGLIIVVSKWDQLADLQEKAEQQAAEKAAKAMIVEPRKNNKKAPNLTKLEKKRLSSTVKYNDNGEIGKDAYTRDTLAGKIAGEFNFVPWAPLIFTSAVTGKNVAGIFELALEIDERRKQIIPTKDLNRWLQTVINQHPPAGLKNHQPKLNYMVQETDNPIPAFKIFGASTKFLHWSYKRYLERSLRELYDYAGSPVQLWFIEKHVAHKHHHSPTKEPREKKR
jgi:GTPase